MIKPVTLMNFGKIAVIKMIFFFPGYFTEIVLTFLLDASFVYISIFITIIFIVIT